MALGCASNTTSCRSRVTPGSPAAATIPKKACHRYGGCSSLRRRWARRVGHPAQRSPDLAAIVPLLVVPPFDLRVVRRAWRCPDDNRLGRWPTPGLGSGPGAVSATGLSGEIGLVFLVVGICMSYPGRRTGAQAPDVRLINGARQTRRCTPPAVCRPEVGGRRRRQAGQRPWRRADRGRGTARTIVRFSAGRWPGELLSGGDPMDGGPVRRRDAPRVYAIRERAGRPDGRAYGRRRMVAEELPCFRRRRSGWAWP